MKNKDKYNQGLIMKQFKHLPEVSVYNCNYYVGIDDDLLFGESDDDNVTEWYLVEGKEFIHLGYSYTSEGEILYKN